MNEKNIDENIQSRSIATFGLENMKKFSKLKVFIYGINGISLETSKNLILTGIKKLTIFDDKITKLEDLSWNFYLNKNDINKKRRDESILLKLKELNDYTDVKIENDLQKGLVESDIIVFAEIKNSNEIYKINEFCRKNNKGFLYANLFGLAGYIFSDFGNHYIFDENGDEKQKVFISSINQKINEKKIVFDVYKDENDGIDNEKYVIFKEIEGMEELNNSEPIKIFKLSEYKYYINYEQKLNNYIKGGIIEEVKIPKKIEYVSYKDYIENPNFLFELDGSKKDRNCQLHCFFLSIQKFFDNYQKLPDINDENQAEEIVNFSKEYYNLFKEKNNKLFLKSKSLDNNFIKSLSLISQAQLATDSSFIGGILAQEILKFSGLYQPINQLLYYNNYITIENLNRKIFDIKSLKKDRYYYENIIYGIDIIEKLKNLNIFIIGAGALGCEFMKLLALMGASVGENSNIILTDNDSIEISNLNRQFFFKKKHIGKNKASVCCDEVKNINPKIKLIALDKLVNTSSEDIFTDDFWSNIDITILAVDNVSARQYIDKKCTSYNIKLIEAGTQGVNASSSLIIPNLTCCYNDIKRNPKKEIPQCTLKYYPLTAIHCIEFAKQKFNDFFYFNIKDAMKIVENHNISFDEETIENLNKLENINKILIIFKNKNFESCLDLALNEFYVYFVNNIRYLLNDFPADLKKNDGSLYWNGDKKMPRELIFDNNDDDQIDFIYYYAYIIAINLKIDIKSKNFSIIYISNHLINNKKILNKNEISEKMKYLIEVNKNEAKLLNINEWENIEFKEFEKDDDSNHHIDFLKSFSNLRAKNYNIESCDRNLVKFISGNIIPAVSTTTSSICGYIISQIYTLLREKYKREDFRELNFGMSFPNFTFKLPTKPKIIKNQKDERKVPYDFTVWDKIEIDGSITVKELTNQLIKKFGFEFDFDGIYTIHDLSLIENEKDINKLIEDLYFSKSPIECENNILLDKMGITKKEDYKNLYLKYYGIINDITTVIFPTIKYHYKPKIN